MLDRVAAKRKFSVLLRANTRGRIVSGRGGLLAHADFASLQRLGMATGGWLAGVLYDHYGFYAPAFAAGFAINLFNSAVIGALALRRRLTLAAAV
jgi:hypothetical protein